MGILDSVPRPKEFDPEVALERAVGVFRANSFEAVTTSDLCAAMGIGRQSLYDTFGDKSSLYLQALRHYQQAGAAASTEFCDHASPLAGLQALFDSIAAATMDERRTGCMIVNAIGELAATDADVATIVARNQDRLLALFADTVRRGQALGEIATDVDPAVAASRLLTTFYGLRVMAKADPGSPAIATTARHAVDFLRL
jgi:TetR/AcrR family transcriptional regulator, transcriptional repressor for nem operon